MITLELTAEEAEVLLCAVVLLQENPGLSSVEEDALDHVHYMLAEAL